MNFREAAEKNEDWIIEQRRYFHQHPELSLKEVNTTRELAKRLEEMGLEPYYFEGITGVMAEIKGGQAGEGAKTVALRADIDALEVEEHTGLEFSSENPGVMHACGHDCHIAMLLGGVKLLMEKKDELKGNVRILFQPAEEVAVGEKTFIQQGALNGVDAIYGTHIWGDFDAPYMSFEYGPRMASCDKFTIDIEGKSAHGSAPHLGVDAVTAAVHVISEAQEVVSRLNDPLNPLVITFGTIQGGQRWNIIPDKVHMEGTVRTLSPEMRKKTDEMLKLIVEHVCVIHGTKGSCTVEYLANPLFNKSEKLCEIAENAAVKLYGENSLKHLEKMMGSEGFSFYMDEVPGIYGFVGSRDPEKGYTATNHNDCYTVDEGLLKRGAAMYAQFAWDFLEAE